MRDKENGIKEVVDAYDKLEAEFKPQAEELKLIELELAMMGRRK